jgi:alkanesulfonate monooxygenase SsuD/methylene tetrahydromethanopterin reductase-like flavin-dependent oxidoreductase (luciferase family)
VGAGWNQPEYDAFGIPFDHRVDRLEEALQIINPLLKEGRVDFVGKYYQARNCVIRPRGPRPEGPPLLMGSFGPRMLHLTAKYADMWNTAYLHQPHSLDDPLAKLHQACRDVGRDPNSLQVTALISLAYPDLGEMPKFEDEPLIGTKEEIAAAIQGYEARGVSHLMFHCTPYNREALDRLAESLALCRQSRSEMNEPAHG